MGAALPPVDLAGKTVLQLSSHLGHVCVLLDDETARCWGYNSAGQLGLGDKNSRGDEPDEMGAALPPVQLF